MHGTLKVLPLWLNDQFILHCFIKLVTRWHNIKRKSPWTSLGKFALFIPFLPMDSSCWFSHAKKLPGFLVFLLFLWTLMPLCLICVCRLLPAIPHPTSGTATAYRLYVVESIVRHVKSAAYSAVDTDKSQLGMWPPRELCEPIRCATCHLLSFSVKSSFLHILFIWNS